MRFNISLCEAVASKIIKSNNPLMKKHIAAVFGWFIVDFGPL